MSQPNGAQPQVQQIQPAPVPAQWQVTPVKLTNGANSVIVQIVTHQGVSVFFLEPEVAKAIAAQLEQAATQSSTGIIIPPPGFRP